MSLGPVFQEALLVLSLKKVWFDYYFSKLCFFLFCRFFFADKAVGAKGFKAIWTEFKDTSNCQEFRCAKSQICISRTLRCNGINNCGHMDTSDEMNCVTESEVIITFFKKIEDFEKFRKKIRKKLLKYYFRSTSS